MEIGSTEMGFLLFTTYLVGGLGEHIAMASITKKMCYISDNQFFSFWTCERDKIAHLKTFSTTEAGGNLVNKDSQSSTYTLQIPGQY